MKISICIPTYNRAGHLRNCLNSILLNARKSVGNFEVCISDNCSSDDTESVVRKAQSDLPIKYQKNSSNLGVPRNFLNAVAMAAGEFVWLLGDDDLLLPDALDVLDTLIAEHPNVDYFYLNSYHLTTDYIAAFPKPFDTANLPKKMETFSSWPQSEELSFLNLVDPRISFDFLGGIFLAAFRRENWNRHIGVLDPSAVSDQRVFSHFDNTFPHIKIFAKAYADSTAYFSVKPLSVNLSGAREWAPMSRLIASVRLVEALTEYRKNGLPFGRYIRCKNFALRNFLPDLAMMYLFKQQSGYAYIQPLKLLRENCVYPNFYLSPLYWLLRQIKRILT